MKSISTVQRNDCVSNGPPRTSFTYLPFINFYDWGISMSIVPEGFNVTAHKVFLNYSPPLFDSDHKDGEKRDSASEDQCCYICLASMVEPVELIECRHAFCLLCISRWLSKGSSCPVCKNGNTYFVNSTHVHRLPRSHTIQTIDPVESSQRGGIGKQSLSDSNSS